MDILELERSFMSVYTKFKLSFYKKIFRRFETREASLTAVETFCVEVINALERPTINEFAQFVNISQANAAYKIQSLVDKGYVTKTRSPDDRREYFLAVTERFNNYNSLSTEYIGEVLRRMRERLSPEDMEKFKFFLDTMSTELMPEVELNLNH